MKKILLITGLMVLLAGFIPRIIFIQAAEISGIIWEDMDQHGAIDSGETRFKDVKVLLKQGTTVIDNDKTNNNGKYKFTELPEGTYRVKVKNSNFNSGEPLENLSNVYDLDGNLNNRTTVYVGQETTIDNVHFGYYDYT